MGILRWVGRQATGLLYYIGGLVLLSGQTFYWLFQPPVKHREIWKHMLQIGLYTLPVSGVIIFLLGMVIAFQTAYQMRVLGGDVLIPGLVAVSITRELGPVMTAVVIAGRVGAAITAELGTMSVTEQIDAVDAMAVPPVKYLVVPRFLAMILMAPLLTIYTDFIGMVGGYAVCVGKLGLSHAYYVQSVLKALVLSDVLSGLAKSFVFAMIICIVSSFEGMRVMGGAGGVGRSTMRSVVASFLFIVLADFIFTMIFYITPST